MCVYIVASSWDFVVVSRLLVSRGDDFYLVDCLSVALVVGFSRKNLKIFSPIVQSAMLFMSVKFVIRVVWCF